MTKKKNDNQKSSLHAFYQKKACQSPVPNTCTVMDNKWVKLSLTLIKSHPLLLLCFYSLSYLLPICLHWPLLRRGAPLILSQNQDSLAHSLPLSIPFKKITSSKPWLDLSQVHPKTELQPALLPSSQRNSQMPCFHLLCLSPFAQKAGTNHKLSLSIGISAAWVFSSWTDSALVGKLFSSGLAPQFQHCSPHCSVPHQHHFLPKNTILSLLSSGIPTQWQALVTRTE